MRRKLVVPFGVCVFIIAALFYYVLRQPVWDGNSRFRMILGSENGEVNYLLFDPKKNEVKIFPLDQSTEIEVAYGLGQWKIGSLWKLGVQENKGGGAMLARSLTRGYGLPIEGFLEYSGPILPLNLARKTIFARSTDISVGERVRLAWFILRTSFSEESKLTPDTIILTGEELVNLVDGIVTIYLSKSVTESQIKAVSLLASNLGGKVLDITESEEKSQNQCLVTGANIFAKKLARALLCNFKEDKNENTHVFLTEEFASRF